MGFSFLKGRREFSNQAQYYLLLLDKSSNGRISIKHFRSIPVSELRERLEKWKDRYQWEFYSPQLGKSQWGTPSIYQIINTAYGVERDGRLVVDKDTFKKDQLQKMIAAMMDGNPLPQGIIKMLKNNIRNRRRYDKTWNGVLYVTKAVLYDEERERVKEMLDRSCNDRSYLFGRLLAIYQFIEEATFVKDEDRLTNAEKVWAAYMAHPATTMNLLENKTSVYINKLKVQKPGLKVRCEKEKADVIGRLDQKYLKEEKGKEQLNIPLDHLFIFGYYAEQQALYTKSAKKENKEDEQ